MSKTWRTAPHRVQMERVPLSERTIRHCEECVAGKRPCKPVFDSSRPLRECVWVTERPQENRVYAFKKLKEVTRKMKRGEKQRASRSAEAQVASFHAGEEPEEVEKKWPSRKDRKKWCRGQMGKEHTLVTRYYGPDNQWSVRVCTRCNHYFSAS